MNSYYYRKRKVMGGETPGDQANQEVRASEKKIRKIEKKQWKIEKKQWKIEKKQLKREVEQLKREVEQLERTIEMENERLHEAECKIDRMITQLEERGFPRVD